MSFQEKRKRRKKGNGLGSKKDYRKERANKTTQSLNHVVMLVYNYLYNSLYQFTIMFFIYVLQTNLDEECSCGVDEEIDFVDDEDDDYDGAQSNVWLFYILALNELIYLYLYLFQEREDSDETRDHIDELFRENIQLIERVVRKVCFICLCETFVF